MVARATADDDSGIKCPACGCRHFEVVETRPLSGNRIFRRRECRNCGRRITKTEDDESPPLPPAPQPSGPGTPGPPQTDRVESLECCPACHQLVHRCAACGADGERLSMYGRDGQVRYYRCQSCGARHKAIVSAADDKRAR